MQFEKWFQIDLQKPPAAPADLGVLLCSGDENSVRVGVRLKEGEISGTVKGYVILPSGIALVPFDGGAEGNAAWIDLPEDALGMMGRISIALRVFDGDETTVLLMAYASVRRVDADEHYDPADFVGDITTLIQDAQQAAADAQEALAEATDIVSYAEQTGKTEEAKAQARANIGAAKAGAEMSTAAKEALLACLARVAWATDDGQDYYDALEALLISDAELVSITAVFDPGQVEIFDNATLNSLKPYLTVTANYSDGGSEVVTGYNLYGTIALGECTITVAYSGKTATFTVTTVDVPSDYTALAWLTATGTQYIDTGMYWSGDSAYEMSVKGLLTDNTTANWFMGAISWSDADGRTVGLNNTANTSSIFFRYGALSGTSGHDFTGNAATEYTVGMEGNVCKLNGATHSTYTAYTYTMIHTIFLFARDTRGTADSFAKCSIARFRLWNGNGDLLQDLAPYLDGNGVPCMFDRVGKQTYYNAGTGNFSYTEVGA